VSRIKTLLNPAGNGLLKNSLALHIDDGELANMIAKRMGKDDQGFNDNSGTNRRDQLGVEAFVGADGESL